MLRKLFYRKPPDGLLEIFVRVYVFDCCFTAHPWRKKDYKTYVEDIIGQLKEHFPDASLLVYNFRDAKVDTQTSKVLSQYDLTLMDYPRSYEGCPILPIELIHHFLRSTESWLTVGPHNVLLMHCEQGGWPTLAFMLSALLIYRKQYTGEHRTLDMVYKQAPRELLASLSPVNPFPSQLRYLQYVSRRNIASQWPPLDRVLILDCIIIRAFPDFDAGGGFRPLLRIYGQDPLCDDDRAAKLLYETPKKSNAVRSYKQAESELVKIDLYCTVRGDVLLECVSLENDMEHEGLVFRVMFNTGFLRSNILMLARDEIDTPWQATDHFPREFRAEVLFSDMDTAASVVAAHLSCFEEKEGLPVEAFAKVQEFFSHEDWLDSGADSALRMLKKVSLPHKSHEIQDSDTAESATFLHTSSPPKLKEGLKPHEVRNQINEKFPSLKVLKDLNLGKKDVESGNLQTAQPTIKLQDDGSTTGILLSPSSPCPAKYEPPPPPPAPANPSRENAGATGPPFLPLPPPLPSKMNYGQDRATFTPPSPPESGSLSSSLPPPPPPPPPPSSADPRQHIDSIPQTSSSAPCPPPPPVSSDKRAPRSGSSAAPMPPLFSPPAAGGRTLSRPPGPKNSQTKKLKPLHWLKLTRAVQGSLWAETQKSGGASNAPEIDMSELENLFSASVPNPDRGIPGGKSRGGITAPKSDKVQLIDHRRAYNCEIMLSKVKVPLQELMCSVLSLEDAALDVDQVDNLIKFCPTKEEMELVKGYNGDVGKLGKCEQFFLELMRVPRVEAKLRVFSFKMQFRTQVSDLRKSLNIVSSASDQIRGSVKLKKIMQTVLSLGNALNQGTARGSAVGFRLDSLLKLTETRARNNKMTLMHYLCKVVAEKLPELLDFSKDLTSIEPASKIQLKFLAEEMQSINKGLEKVVQELSLSDDDGPVSKGFHKNLKEFLSFAETDVRSLALLYSGVGKSVDALIIYFGEDPARCPFEQVLSNLYSFTRMFDKAHEDNCKQLEIEKKKVDKDLQNQKL